MQTAASANPPLTTSCCIAGGGPAGMMLGFLLARAGVDVVVLEKHADFLRDFRGDTVHPSTLELIFELGLIDEFLQVPHQEVNKIRGQIGDSKVIIADFTHLPVHCRFIAMMPQWDFLNFVAAQAAKYPNFRLMMNTAATDLLTEGGRVVGVRTNSPEAPSIGADLVIGADGRTSLVRERAGLAVKDLGAPMDVFWMRIPKQPTDENQTLGRIDTGHILALIDRHDYWQCAFVIPKGSAEQLRQRGLPALLDTIAGLVPELRNGIQELKSWDDVKLLTVQVNRLPQWWREGLLCIGDAAHAMSPIGGVGINLGVQDAVAAANILWKPLRDKALTPQYLKQVQERRMFPTRVIQWMQVAAQRVIIRRVLAGENRPGVPRAVRMSQRFPVLQRLPARLIGLGVRPEHIQTPDAKASGAAAST
jgi:2-polyprenyl-6-methoxyphenol hydroxylase-like FAD-dependent oxidoreductase